VSGDTSGAFQPTDFEPSDVFAENERRERLYQRLDEIQTDVMARRERVLVALRDLHGLIPKNFTAGKEEEHYPSVADAFLRLCQVASACGFGKGIELIIERDSEEAGQTERLAIHLFRLAWQRKRGELASLLRRIDHLPSFPDSFDTRAANQEGIHYLATQLLDNVVPYPWNVGLLPKWLPDLCEVSIIQAEMSGAKKHGEFSPRPCADPSQAASTERATEVRLAERNNCDEPARGAPEPESGEMGQAAVEESLFKPEQLDPSRCPGCRTPVPQPCLVPNYTCARCASWQLFTGLLVVPAAGPPGTPPSVIQTASPYWLPAQQSPNFRVLQAEARADASEPFPRVAIVSALDHEFVAMKAMLDGATACDRPDHGIRYFFGKLPASKGEAH
jgi:hypothetical protein